MGRAARPNERERMSQSVLYRIRDRRSVDQGQEAPPRPSLIFAVLVAEFLDEKFFFGTESAR